MVTSLSSGHSAEYLTGQVGAGRESYYLDATTAGEPPGRWYGKGAEAFGLVGEIDHEVMHALYSEFRDPRDPKFEDVETRSEAARLGRAPGRYKSAAEILADKIEAARSQSVRIDPGQNGLAPTFAEPGAVDQDAVSTEGLLPEQVERLALDAEREARQPVAFLDATFSPPKSVTVAHTAFSRMELDAEKAGDLSGAAEWRHRRLVVEEAIWAGNQAMLDNLSERAGFSRTGQHRGKNGNGSGRWIDAHDWTVASFFQHTSRDLDPQLHVHNAILNRVVCDDGQVRTLDSKSIYAHRQGAGTIGDRTMEAYLTARLGTRWVMRKDGVGREIEGIGQTEMDLFSERSAKIGRKLSGLVEEFRTHFDREPTALELDRMRRQSTMATRRAKTHDGENRGQMLDRWDDALRGELAGGLSRVAANLATTHTEARAAGRLASAPDLSANDHAEALADLPAGWTGGHNPAEDGDLSADVAGGQVGGGSVLPAGRADGQNPAPVADLPAGWTGGQNPAGTAQPGAGQVGGQGIDPQVSQAVAGMSAQEIEQRIEQLSVSADYDEMNAERLEDADNPSGAARLRADAEESRRQADELSRAAGLGSLYTDPEDEWADAEGEDSDLSDLSAIAEQTAAGTSPGGPADRPTGRMVQPVNLSTIEEQLVRQRQGQQRPTWSDTGVIAEAVAACQKSRAAFSRSELIRQVLLALPDNLPTVRVGMIAETLADRALSDAGQVVQVTGAQPTRTVPRELQLASGASAYAAPGGIRYATQGHIVAEQALRRASVERGRRAADVHQVEQWLTKSTPGQTLGPDQAAAVRGLMTSGAALSVLVGPAGTGKSHTVGALSEGWSKLTGGKVFGLATSQIATEVLAEDGVNARNISQWLILQARLAKDGQARPADRQFQLTADDLVVVDEASMVDTVQLERIRRHVDRAGARLVLTGDPRQLAAVGAGGAMEMLADGVAETHTLAEVRRFNNAWEREASLRLRDGDPDVIHEYDRRGRIMTTGTRDNAGNQAARAYLGDSLAGKRSIVVVPTNAEAAGISAHIRDELVQLGRVQAEGTILGLDGNVCGVGDLVQARKNAWSLGVINRRRYLVEEIHESGDMVVRIDGTTELRTLPASYVEQHLTLGYASTAHSAQGVTVDTSHAVISEQMSGEALYVALSRGREANTAWVVTQPEVADEPTGATHGREQRSANAVIAEVIDQDAELERAALVQQAEDVRRARSMYTVHAQYEEAMRFVDRIRTDRWLDRLAVEDVVSEDERLALASDQATDQLARLLRAAELAGHSPTLVLREAVTEQRLDNAQSIAQVLQYRITNKLGSMRPTEDQLGDSQPLDVPEHWQQHLDELGEAAADRRRQLGTEAAEEPEEWALDAFGPVPEDLVARAEWEHRAGIVAGYQEAHPSDHEDGAVLGPAPGTSTPEKRAAWHAAWNALGRPEATAEEANLSEGTLRIRIKAWQREQQWAPRPVNAEMRATGQNRARYEQEAAILRAQADATRDADERARLTEEAEGRQALAETMREIEAGLAEVAEERAAWYIETAATREAAERAQAALSLRGRDIGGEDDRVTTEEWLTAHDAAVRAEEAAREQHEEDELRAAETHLTDEERRLADEMTRRTAQIIHAQTELEKQIVDGQRQLEQQFADAAAGEAATAREQARQDELEAREFYAQMQEDQVEILDPDADDVVQHPADSATAEVEVVDAELVDVRQTEATADDDAVHEETEDQAVAAERASTVEQDTLSTDHDVVDAELVDVDQDEQATEDLQTAEDEVVDAEVIDPGLDDVDQDDKTTQGEADRDSSEPEASVTVAEPVAEADEPKAAAADEAEERQLPRGVPTPAETEVAVDGARAAADELRDRRSQDQARRQAEVDREAERAQEARESAWRERELQAERDAATTRERQQADADDEDDVLER
ncbi:MobF family relaxase [Kribbella sp. NPDC058693]|uniref:MobF family relaxase n=1 Tax=Kribbella sp. NPDC058693 TaxID=3346602 RepID=UPI003649898F